jgi:demethylmenaquinone methyltransferase/2-methoxy-6-polyprenyl-1,4-benzoquinol methylase/phosphoethanolamine N-methyltransferase
MVLQRKHPGSQQSNRERGEESAPQTKGRTITWAWLYDYVVGFLSLGKEQALRRMTVDLARLQPGESVLDVGCGTGALTRLARKRVGASGKVYGIDAAPQMIAVARRKAARRNLAINFQVGLIEQLNFPDDSFDVVLSSLMMHHLPGELKRQGLAETARVLKPGGRLLILDFQAKQNQSRIKGHVQQRGGSHAFLAQLLHAGKELGGIQALPPMMKEVGFTQIEAGETGFRWLGFVLGRTSAERTEQ